jgi:hypothetical protein
MLYMMPFCALVNERQRSMFLWAGLMLMRHRISDEDEPSATCSPPRYLNLSVCFRTFAFDRHRDVWLSGQHFCLGY